MPNGGGMRHVKGVLLAGGTGSRLYPLTQVTNKHLLPVGEQPMIFYPLQTLLDAHISDILIVTGREHMGDVVTLLGSGEQWGCTLTYRVQDQAGGIAHALGLARGFCKESPCAVILGDNLFEDSLAPTLRQFVLEQEAGAHLFLKKVLDPARFGVATVEGNCVTSLEEKPAQPKSDLAVTGLYLFDEQVFTVIDQLKPSSRGELEITDVNNAYLRQNKLTFSVLQGHWTDAGTFESLWQASNMVRIWKKPLLVSKQVTQDADKKRLSGYHG